LIFLGEFLMPNLPVIPGATVITTPAVPAVPAGNYASSALVNLTLQTPPGAVNLLGQTISVTFCPADTTQTPTAILPQQRGPGMPMQPQQIEQLPPRNIWLEAQRCPLFAQAMGAVLTYAIPALQEFRLQKQIKALTDQITQVQRSGVDVTALQATLAALHASLATEQAALAALQTQMGVPAGSVAQ
jgi:hypothetical protein